MKSVKREYNGNIRRQRTVALTALLLLAVSVVFIPRSMSAKSKRHDINAMARQARLDAYMTAALALSTDDSAFYAKRRLTRAVGENASADPSLRQWALFEEMAMIPARLREPLVQPLVDELARNPKTADRYYIMAISEGNVFQQYETVRRWVRNNPDNMMANRMWLFMRAFTISPDIDLDVAAIFSDYIAGRSDTLIAEEVLADAADFRRRFGVNPMTEDVAFRMMAVKGDTAAILARAAELVGTYGTDPAVGPVLLQAYVAAGRPDEANRLRIKLFESNPSGEMMSRVFGSLTTRADTTNLFSAVVRSIRRPDLDLDEKTELINHASYVLTHQHPEDEEQANYFLALADSVVDASREVMAEFDDDWSAVREITNIDRPEWVRYKSYPLLVDYALAHPDSLEINYEIASRLIDLVDSVPELGDIIMNLRQKLPDRVDIRLLYPVWLANMERHAEAVDELAPITIDDLRLAFKQVMDRRAAGNDFDDDNELDSVAFERAVHRSWAQTKGIESQSLFKLGRYRQASDSSLAALPYVDEDEDKALLLNNAAYFLGESNNDLERALALADSSLNLVRAPNSIDTRAWILHKLGRDSLAFDQMKEIFCKAVEVGDFNINLCNLTDYKALEADLLPLFDALESEKTIADISFRLRRFLIAMMFNSAGVSDSESAEEYLLHLFEILRSLGDDYAAFSVGLWLDAYEPDDRAVVEQIYALATKLGIDYPPSVEAVEPDDDTQPDTEPDTPSDNQ